MALTRYSPEEKRVCQFGKQKTAFRLPVYAIRFRKVVSLTKGCIHPTTLIILQNVIEKVNMQNENLQFSCQNKEFPQKVRQMPDFLRLYLL